MVPPRFCFASSSYQVSTTARKSSRRKPQAHPITPDNYCFAGICLGIGPCSEDDWRCSVRYSDDDCTPDSDDECGDEDRRI